MSDKGSSIGREQVEREAVDGTGERAALLLVARDQRIRSAVGEELRKRYGADYHISIHDDRKHALDALESMKVRQVPVALVLSAVGPRRRGHRVLRVCSTPPFRS